MHIVAPQNHVLTSYLPVIQYCDCWEAELPRNHKEKWGLDECAGIQYNWCPLKQGLGHTEHRVEMTMWWPWEGSISSRGESPQKKPVCRKPWFWTSNRQNRSNVIVVHTVSCGNAGSAMRRPSQALRVQYLQWIHLVTRTWIHPSHFIRRQTGPGRGEAPAWDESRCILRG